MTHKKQLTLPFPAVRQTRKSQPEKVEIYASVLRLRETGSTVYRSGESQHVVDGKLLNHLQLIRCAQAILG